MTVIVPVKPVPNQRFACVLGGQNCELHIYYRRPRLYLDLIAGGTTVGSGLVCTINQSLVVGGSPNFAGYLFFIDDLWRGVDPFWEELGTRFTLCYDDGETP